MKWMNKMFMGCSSLTSLDLSHFKTDNVSNMESLFEGCSSLTSLDLSNFNTTKVGDVEKMFYNCSNLVTITVGDGWDLSLVNSQAYYPNDRDMFRNCTSLVGCMGTKYDSYYVNKRYAHIDGGPSNPGYLSAVVMPGDIDGTGEVSIADVTLLIDYILTGQGTGLNLVNADVDGNGEVNIADVTVLIDMLLTAVEDEVEE